MSTLNIAEIIYMYVITWFTENANFFLNVGNLVIDWEQRRYELAKDIIKAVIADDRGGNSDAIAKYAVNCADALIKRLKEVNNG